MVQDKRLYPPPKPSLPKEAPWREIEEIIDLLREVAARLAGVAPTAAPTVVTPTIIAPAPAELKPLTDRLDLLISMLSNKSTFRTGQKDVPTHGVPEQLDELEVPNGCQATVIARTGNTGYMYVGRTKAECANNKQRFDGLAKGIAISLPVKNLSAIWIDVDNDDEGASWIVPQV